MSASRPAVRPLAVALAALLLAAAAPALAAEDAVDPDAARLRLALDALDDDASLADLAGVERLKARQALEAFEAARPRERDAAFYVARVRAEAARLAAEAALAERQVLELERERDRLLLAASRREVERARREAERLRLQSLVAAEEAERVREFAEAETFARTEAEAAATRSAAEAEQARRVAAAREREAALAREEAELAAQVVADAIGESAPMPPIARDARGEVITLAGDAFSSGSATLTAGARASLRRVAEHLRGTQGRVLVEGHTDSQGQAAANQALSQRRADAVRAALVDAGVDASRLAASGKGATTPVADNGSAEGRARNRRVEIIIGG